MDFTEIIKAMEDMTDAQVTSIQKSAEGILKVRENEKKAKAIQNFKKAFEALRAAGVDIYYVECEIEDCYDSIRVNEIERFGFSY
jgi:ATP-dependent 26S proteasome regulatory subunit